MPKNYRHALKLSMLFCLCLVPLMSGCESKKPYPVYGKVRMTGGPNEGEIRFQPMSAPGQIATGRIEKDGTFKVSGEGVLQGPCKVVLIVEPRKGKPVVHERYTSFDTTDLVYEVTERDQNYFIIDTFGPDK